MYSDHCVLKENLKFPFSMEAGNGKSVQHGRNVPVEYWLGDDKYRERNFATLVKHARDPVEMLEDLGGVYPGSVWGVRERLGLIPEAERLERELVVEKDSLDRDEGVYSVSPGEYTAWSIKQHTARIAEIERQLTAAG